MRILSFIILLLFIAQVTQGQKVDIQGHRGCRGLLPENSIPAFIHAIDLGVTTLEMDVVITKDHQVILSHDSYLNPDICTDPEGQKIKNEHDYPIFQMNYQEVAKCDCGSNGNPRFPQQKKVKVSKPLLSSVIDTVESYIKAHQLPSVQYNIETKLSPEGDGTLHPVPKEFTDLLVKVIQEKDITDRTIIQSFDIRTLQYAHEQYQEIPLALLIENKNSLEDNLANLGFTPSIYSPYYLLVNAEMIKAGKEKGMKIIPWTVNENKDIKKMLQLGVDGIISDYPNRVLKMVQN